MRYLNEVTRDEALIPQSPIYRKASKVDTIEMKSKSQNYGAKAGIILILASRWFQVYLSGLAYILLPSNASLCL